MGNQNKRQLFCKICGTKLEGAKRITCSESFCVKKYRKDYLKKYRKANKTKYNEWNRAYAFKTRLKNKFNEKRCKECGESLPPLTMKRVCEKCLKNKKRTCFKEYYKNNKAKEAERKALWFKNKKNETSSKNSKSTNASTNSANG